MNKTEIKPSVESVISEFLTDNNIKFTKIDDYFLLPQLDIRLPIMTEIKLATQREWVSLHMAIADAQWKNFQNKLKGCAPQYGEIFKFKKG